ncbi:hypothetical protein PHMEG_00015906 [Phytophthora megakarya]|uniref:Uncharacterized protein n=1 Tax=Phytophthora megakarya TaxID=4795 RepID=A0A225W0K1_9STRA|nr:hypothetical protein PHMEG_00015906 [Phytophthora megakarya]
MLAGYKDLHQACITPSINTLEELPPELTYAQLLALHGHLFKTVCDFTHTSLNVDSMILGRALLIHLEEISAVVTHEQATSGFTSHYLLRFHEALDSTNAALGSRLLLENCVGWGRQLRSAWEMANYVQLSERCGGHTDAFLNRYDAAHTPQARRNAGRTAEEFFDSATMQLHIERSSSR